MSPKAGLEWNQLQLQIAKLISQKKTTSKIVAELGCSNQSVWKVGGAINSGDKPPSLDDAYIAQAPPPTIIGKTPTKPKITTEQAPATVTKAPQAVYPAKHAPTIYTSAIQFAAQLQPIPITPDIFVSYMVALMRGYNGELVDWLSLVSRDYWSGREKNMYEIFSGFTPSKESQEAEVAVGTPTG